jgi:hypothetical protein
MDMTEARGRPRRPCFLLGRECEAGNIIDRHGISSRTASPFREAMTITRPFNSEFAIVKLKRQFLRLVYISFYCYSSCTSETYL